MSKLVSIITLCYNELESATKPFIESLYKYTDKNLFELIVVNNNSTDGTKKFLEEISNKYDNIKIIDNKENRGFAGGNNQGITAADGEYMVLINNDTLLTPNWLEDMIDVLNSNPKIGIAAPMTNGTGYIGQLIKHPELVTVSNYLNVYKKHLKSNKKITYTDRVIGFCMVMKKSLIAEIGMLDESFGLAWGEDDDYCLRVLEFGYHIAVAQQVFVYHAHSITTRKLESTRDGQLLLKNNISKYKQKHSYILNFLEIEKLKYKTRKKIQKLFYFVIFCFVFNLLFTLAMMFILKF